MSINKSELDKKWYSKGAKYFFWILQMLVAISSLSQGKGIFVLYDLVLGFVLYGVIMIGIWKVIVYLIHGKVEKGDEKTSVTIPSSQENVPREISSEGVNTVIKTILFVIILIIVLMYFFKQFEIRFFSYDEEQCLESRSLSTGRITRDIPCRRPSLIKSCAPFCSFPRR